MQQNTVCNFDTRPFRKENTQLPTFKEPMNPTQFQLEHEIFILDAYLEESLDPKHMESWTRKFIDAMLAALRMEELGALQIYPAADKRAPGWSFIQPITTSHISGHYFEKPGKHPHIRLDCYSCTSINWRKILKVCNEHMKMGIWRATFIDRQIDERERHAVHISGEGINVLDELDLLDHDKHLVAVHTFQESAEKNIEKQTQEEVPSH